jgi:tRNA pseudouridine38-40 synthase
VSRILKLVLSYDGTDYVGWQRQANGVSIQALIEEALAPIEGREVSVVGAGRTDAGVHALGQVASVSLESPIEVAALRRALNATLPADVRVRDASEAPSAFHARFSACGKAYRYCIRHADWVSPFERRYVLHVPQPLNDRAMVEAARVLVGRHDFAAFQAAGSDVVTTERTVHDLTITRVEEEAGALVMIDIEADGFLRHMVRTVAGTLVEVGQGRREPSDVARVLASRDRSQAGPTAPAHGLFLVRVSYERRSRQAAPPPLLYDTK